MKLKGKVTVVTGAASGMGKAIAERYAEEGAKVVLADINGEGAGRVADRIRACGGTARALKVDVTKAAEIELMIDTAIQTYGTLDVLVNNAGIMDGMEPVGELSDEKWDLLFDVNVKSVMRAMRKAMPVFLEKESGVIINIASTGGLSGAHAGAGYTASKHAVVGLTKNTAFMYANKGIRVNAIAPGGVKTNIGSTMKNVSSFGAGRTQIAQSVMPDAGEAEEIAAVALFLASEEASFVNGSVVVADGGWTAAF